VFAVLHDRKESELLIDPRRMRELVVRKWEPPLPGDQARRMSAPRQQEKAEVDFINIAPFVPVFDPRNQPLTVRHDLNELKLCMYEAISDSLNRCPLPPDKLSVALAVAIDEYLGREGEARIERYSRDAALHGAAHQGHHRDDDGCARCRRRRRRRRNVDEG